MLFAILDDKQIFMKKQILNQHEHLFESTEKHQKVAKIMSFIVLSPESKLFFIFSSVYYVFFKSLLALQMIFLDGYSAISFMTPPISLIFASEDIVYLFLFSLFVSRIIPERFQRKTFLIAGVVTVFLLITNFIIHSYFKTFLNFGLLKFNGAGTREISNYILGSFNIFFATFLVISTILTTLFILDIKRIRERIESIKTVTIIIIFGAALLTTQIFQVLNAGQEGWLASDPSTMLIFSTITGIAKEEVVQQYDEDTDFTPPQKLIFGTGKGIFDEKVSPLPYKPNILFILTESLAYKHTPMSGNTGSPLSELSIMAEHGISFSNFRTIFPATSRSLISSLCGIYPDAGYETITKYKPSFECDSILKNFKKNGYRTGFFTSSIFSYDNLHQAKLMNDFDKKMDFFDFLKFSKTATQFSQAVEEEIVVKSLKEFITNNKPEPFFALYFAFWSHAPYRLPDRDISNLPPLERYYETLKYLNSIFKDINNFLAENGYDKNTIVIFSSDHGEAFGEHDSYTHDGNIWEENIHNPLLIIVPDLNKKMIDPRTASNIDIAPTLFYLAGIKSSSSWEGQNLLGENFVEKPNLIFSRSAITMNGVVDGNYKYFYDLLSGKDYFFDLNSDPLEKNNLSEEKKIETARYKDIIRKWISYQNYKILNTKNSQ